MFGVSDAQQQCTTQAQKASTIRLTRATLAVKVHRCCEQSGRWHMQLQPMFAAGYGLQPEAGVKQASALHTQLPCVSHFDATLLFETVH